MADQPRQKANAILLHIGGNGPIFLRAEQIDLAFAVNNQPQRDRLHPPGRLCARQLAPQNRGKREAYQIIQRATRAIRINQIMVEVAGPRHRLRHRGLGNGVKGNALYPLRKRLFLRQNFLDVPTNGLALTIRVSRKDQRVRPLGFISNRFELLGFIRIGFPCHRKAIVRIN